CCVESRFPSNASTISNYPSGHVGATRHIASTLDLTERVSGLRVCEELNPSTVLTEERVQVEYALSQLSPVSKEKVSCSPRSSGPEWNVAHVDHSRVAALTLDSKDSLRSGFRQDSRLEVLGY